MKEKIWWFRFHNYLKVVFCKNIINRAFMVELTKISPLERHLLSWSKLAKNSYLKSLETDGTVCYIFSTVQDLARRCGIWTRDCTYPIDHLTEVCSRKAVQQARKLSDRSPASLREIFPVGSAAGKHHQIPFL